MSAEYRQAPPFCVDVEATEGCNLRCAFCGIQAIRERTGDYQFMTLATARSLAVGMAANKWTSRVEISGHGEPTMNMDLEALVHMFRMHLPNNQILVTSNGGGLLGKERRVADLFAAGLNILALDDYAPHRLVPKVLAKLHKLTIPIVRYPQDGLEVSPHKRHPPGTKMIVVIQDITEATTGVHAKPNNRGGQAAPPSAVAAGRRCVKPFRDMVVRWDGTVNSCCNDYRGLYRCGNVNDSDAESIWNGRELAALRRYLYHGMREFAPCKGCDFVGMRPGLLPDKLGKLTLPKPTTAFRKAAQAALKWGPHTPPVKRPWE